MEQETLGKVERHTGTLEVLVDHRLDSIVGRGKGLPRVAAESLLDVDVEGVLGAADSSLKT